MMLTAYKPACSELWFKQRMMSDEKTMSYNRAWGGTIPFPPEKWPEWYGRWMDCSEKQRYYRYLKDETDAFVGEISYRYDMDQNRYMADVVIYSPFRGRGYGSTALEMLCRAAAKNGITELYDSIAADNPGIRLFLKQGFTETERTEAEITVRKNLLS